MPQFFIHLRTERGLDSDDVGAPFPDLEAAYLDACRAIPAMVEGLLRQGHDPMRCAFEIVDEAGRALMEVPFAERLTRVAPPRPAVVVAGLPPYDLITASASIVAKSQEVRGQVRQTRDEIARFVMARRRSSTAAPIPGPRVMGSGKPDMRLRNGSRPIDEAGR